MYKLNKTISYLYSNYYSGWNYKNELEFNNIINNDYKLNKIDIILITTSLIFFILSLIYILFLLFKII